MATRGTRRGQDDGGIEEITSALRQAFPDNPTPHADLVHLLLDLKELAAAEAEPETSLALFPNTAWLHHMYARCADQAGETAAAAVRWIDCWPAIRIMNLPTPRRSARSSA